MPELWESRETKAWHESWMVGLEIKGSRQEQQDGGL